MKRYTISWNGRKLLLGSRTTVMGVVNVTPDSFSDGGQFHSTEAAVRQGKRLEAAGADILDIGGESTRPYADPVSEAEELERVIPVIEALSKSIAIPISIDTTKAAVASAAVASGASIINDISALRSDEGMAQVVAKAGVPVVVMHMQGTPGNMQRNPSYNDVVQEVKQFLSHTITSAVSKGIAKERMIIDPGIGFGKTGHHNLLLIKHLDSLADLDVPLLIGTSRKRFIRDIVKAPELDDIAADLPEVETGTQATMAAAILNGAHIVRVHNVVNTRAMVDVLDAIRCA